MSDNTDQGNVDNEGRLFHYFIACRYEWQAGADLGALIKHVAYITKHHKASARDKKRPICWRLFHVYAPTSATYQIEQEQPVGVRIKFIHEFSL